VEPPELPIEHVVLKRLKERVELAKKIDGVQHRAKKANHEKNWLQETADALEIELDPYSEEQQALQQARHNTSQVASYKAELRALVADRVMIRGLSAKYITSGSQPVAEELLSSSYHDNLVGVNKSTATQDVANQTPREVRTKKR